MSVAGQVALGVLIAVAFVATLAIMFGPWYYALWRIWKDLRKQRQDSGLTIRRRLKQLPSEMRAEGLTTGERVFVYVHAAVTMVLPTCAIALAIFGRDTTRAVGIGLLGLTLLIYALPVTPFLQARVRRRQRESE